MDGDRDELLNELEVLESIFPEFRVEKAGDECTNFEGSIPIKVSLQENAKINLTLNNNTKSASSQLQYLPPVILKYSLPPRYPLNEKPIFEVACLWLDSSKVAFLNNELEGKWDGGPVLYDIIDYLNEQASIGFEEQLITTSDPKLYDDLVLFNSNASREIFNQHTYKCEICQYDKKGSKCVQLSTCNHVFCSDCLVVYFNVCIDQGFVSRVLCPAVGCASPQLDETQLKELIGESKLLRYHWISRKLRLEAIPNSYVVCPRDSCQALIAIKDADNLLSICQDCDFAFCRVCKRTWHGKFQYCKIDKPSDKTILDYMDGTEEVRLQYERKWGKKNMTMFVNEYESNVGFLKYLEENSTQRCPDCNSPIERSSGCNKMVCSVCQSFFCYLCGKALHRDDPYSHYLEERSSCYKKLFTDTEIDQFIEDED